MEVDRLPHLLRQPFDARVDAAHQALQLGELADHVGRQVRLGEPRGFRRRLRHGRIRAERLARDPLRERLDPLRLFLVGPELLVEQQRAEPVDPRLERRLAVGLPEESRVAQTRGHHALGVARDRPLVVGLGVDHREKRVLQLPVVAFHRKVMLMVNQRRRQHLFGKLEELEREGAGDDRWVLDEVRNLLEQRGILAHGAADAALQALRFRIQLARDLVVPLAALEDHEILEQPRTILVERSHLDGAPRAAARRQEAMAVGDRARRHVLHLAGLRRRRPGDGERHDAPAVQEQHPANRPAEQQLAAAVLEHRVPVHGLRERQRAQRAAENGGQHVDRCLAALPPAEREVLALRRVQALERRHLDALLGRKAGRGGRRRPVRLERGRHRWAVDQLLQIDLALRDADDADGEAARRAERFHRRLGRKAMLAQLRRDDLADLVGQVGQPARRQLLASDLQ